MRLNRLAAAGLAVAVAMALASAPATAQQDDSLFRGKQIAVLIGTGAAGGYDLSARLLARHYGRFVPGNPNVIAKNVPGAGGLRLANQIYNVSPKDGSELGMFATSVAMEPLFGNKQAKFDTNRFTWIGNMDSESATGCGTWKHTGIKTWQDVQRRETTFGSAGPSGVSSINPKLLAALLDLKTKVIVGYTSTHNVLLAMERGELDGSCALNLRATKAEFAEQIKNGDLTMWITFSAKRSSEFPDTPTVHELMRNDDDRALAQLIFGQNKLNRPVAAPPGMDDARTTTLRDAFMATMSDPTFLAEAEKANISVRAMSGDDTRREFLGFYKNPKAIVERAIAIIGRSSEE